MVFYHVMAAFAEATKRRRALYRHGRTRCGHQLHDEVATINTAVDDRNSPVMTRGKRNRRGVISVMVALVR
ncbi:MAG TPA: hypothetical protein VLR47_01245, partial [Rhodospirillales bacterium]|nr:hypothetical protein [Rhodospirillales bacterium]